MWASLSTAPGAYMLVYFIPVFTEEPKSFQESMMFLISPTTCIKVRVLSAYMIKIGILFIILPIYWREPGTFRAFKT
jgi:hypothetical protein